MWQEWSYSVGLMVPADLYTDPAELETRVRTDLPSAGSRNPDTYYTADPEALNRINVMVVRRSGDPATRWETVMSESQAKTREGDADFNDVTQTWSEGTLDASKDLARQDVRNWLAQWDNSEFTHSGTVYDINAEQERRFSVTQGQARVVGTGFTSGWYAKDGSKVDFPNRDTWDAFYRDFHAHLESGNATYEKAMSDIDKAADTAALDAVLNGLPAIPGAPTTRASGPLPGGEGDQGATQPHIEPRRKR